jgi:hypothetical protein
MLFTIGQQWHTLYTMTYMGLCGHVNRNWVNIYVRGKRLNHKLFRRMQHTISAHLAPTVVVYLQNEINLNYIYEDPARTAQ